MFGPGVWMRAVKASRKGHRIGKPVGNPWTMPGSFLVHRQQIFWSHRFEHAGDHPDFEAMPGRSRDFLVAQDKGSLVAGETVGVSPKAFDQPPPRRPKGCCF